MQDYNYTLIILALSFTAFMCVVKFKKHHHMLTANVACCSFSSLYLYLNDATIGAIVSGIAACAVITQILLNSTGHKISAQHKNNTAIGFSLLAVMILYQKPSDLLPCIAFTQNRLLEAQGNPQYIRAGVAFGSILWSIYSLAHGLLIMAILEVAIALYALRHLAINRQPKIPTAPQASITPVAPH
ncbi:MAG: hypothetical protein CL570_02890 [Alphaproteobacteria bacterium]|nr:hypothetical protein [Alphaproteobacteria bacterium]|tara:strand:- start:397 stop:954 length:558 start_codon:yes stop_codon:yes gene_type:complete